MKEMMRVSKLPKLTLIAIMLTGGLFAQTEPTNTDGDGKREVSTLDHLLWISQNSSGWGYDYEQTADIDATDTQNWNGGSGFSPIGLGSTKFTGTYDGQGYIINKLYIHRSTVDNIGLFGSTNGATLKNLGITDIHIAGNNNVGGLVGECTSSNLSKCYSTGNVIGYSSSVGGLVGSVGSSTISNCYSSCSVDGNGSYTGGISGYNSGNTISNCYNTGSVDGAVYYVGGLVGALFSSCNVNNCYNTGHIYYYYTVSTGHIGGLVGYNSSSTVSNSFWDTQTSGLSSSNGGTGKTTAQMKALATFTDEDSTGLTTAWDFVSNPYDDSANDDIWDMDLSGTINSGYPYLSWQDGEDQSLPVELASFTATAGNGRITLTWTTESEIDNLGFNIYRSRSAGGQFVKINDSLIPGAGSSSNRHEYDYTDIDVINGINYWYKLEDVDYRGNTALHGLVSAMPVKSGAPGEYCLHPNYPNPFNPVTRIAYDLPEEGNVRLAVYDLSGREIKTLLSGRQESGSYQITWDGTDQNGELVSSGVYFLSITSGSYSKTHKMVFVR